MEHNIHGFMHHSPIPRATRRHPLTRRLCFAHSTISSPERSNSNHAAIVSIAALSACSDRIS
jgi:hypothetical protein